MFAYRKLGLSGLALELQSAPGPLPSQGNSFTAPPSSRFRLNSRDRQDRRCQAIQSRDPPVPRRRPGPSSENQRKGLRGALFFGSRGHWVRPGLIPVGRADVTSHFALLTLLCKNNNSKI